MEPPVVIDLVPDSPPVQPVSNSLNLILNQDNSGSNRISNATALPVNTAKGKPQVPSVAKTANTNKTLNTIPNTMKTTTKAGRTVKSSGAVKSGTGKDSPLKNSRSKSSQGATKSSKGSSNGSQGKEGSVSSQVNSYEEMEKKIISRFAASRQKLSYGRLIGHLHDKAKFDEGIKKLPLYLGRTSTSVPEQYAKATKLNIGDSKSASRYHAMIEWDSTVHQLRIHCLGRNGVLLDGKILLEGKSELLAQDKSTAICIGGAELYFCPAISMDFPTSNHCAFVQMAFVGKPKTHKLTIAEATANLIKRYADYVESMGNEQNISSLVKYMSLFSIVFTMVDRNYFNCAEGGIFKPVESQDTETKYIMLKPINRTHVLDPGSLPLPAKRKAPAATNASSKVQKQ